MTKVQVFISNVHEDDDRVMTNYDYKALSSQGHTKKEVCNAISGLVWALASALATKVGLDAVNVVEDGGAMLVSLEIEPTAQTNLIFETVICGLNQIRENHPKHVHPLKYLQKPTESGVS